MAAVAGPQKLRGNSQTGRGESAAAAETDAGQCQQWWGCERDAVWPRWMSGHRSRDHGIFGREVARSRDVAGGCAGTHAFAAGGTFALNSRRAGRAPRQRCQFDELRTRRSVCSLRPLRPAEPSQLCDPFFKPLGIDLQLAGRLLDTQYACRKDTVTPPFSGQARDSGTKPTGCSIDATFSSSSLSRHRQESAARRPVTPYASRQAGRAFGLWRRTSENASNSRLVPRRLHGSPAMIRLMRSFSAAGGGTSPSSRSRFQCVSKSGNSTADPLAGPSSLTATAKTSPLRA
jgi:hypothetical protein